MRHWLFTNWKTDAGDTVFKVRDRVGNAAYAGDPQHFVTDPLGRSNGLYLTTPLTLARATTYGDYTVGFWAKYVNDSTVIRLDSEGGILDIRFPAADRMRIVSADFDEEFDIDSIVTTWRWFVVRRSGAETLAYQNMILKKTLAGDTAIECEGVVLNYGEGGQEAKLFDLRVKASAISLDALNYYYADLLTGGKKCLP